MRKDWVLEDCDLKNKSLIERLLYIRGIKTKEEINDFLNPLEMTLTSPDAFVDMPKVVERLSKAIDNNEKILIYGDFDADGVTSTSILLKTIQHLNGNIEYYIPSRETEGHGFNTNALIKIMTKIKPKVIISVDCGISDVEAITFVNSFKTIDTIITDHHEAPEVLPNAYAIINPKAPNTLDEKLSAKQIEHLTYLAGCGVAFKVAQALLTKYNETGFIYDILPFVAVGTVADVVPLIGENRHLVTKGLDLISKGKHEGLKRLLERAGFDITKGITSENIAFGVAPRINASGRLSTVDDALKVLTSENPHEIENAITSLEELNTIRQTRCQEIFEQADEMVRKEGNKNPAIILANEDWDVGIVGIVASKLVEKYYKPTFLMVYNKEKNQYRCSARSIEGVPLYDVIAANSELLDGFGGHALAAGLSFSGEKTPFEIVKKALNETVKEYVATKDLKPFVKIDLTLTPDDITTDLVEEISKLEPFGASNPPPIFEIKDMKISEKRLMGKEKNHLRLTINNGANDFNAIWWKKGDINLSQGDNLDVAFHPQINEFNGNISVQLIIDDIHSDNLKEEKEIQICKYKIYDNRTKTGIWQNVNDYIKTSPYKIKIFAESRYILDTIKSYPEISSRTFTRQDIPKCDIVMFFDYPADKQTLDLILEKSSPAGVHFMNYEIQTYDEIEFLQKFIGMIRFASNNNNGKFELVRCASFLGKSINIIEMLLQLLEEFDCIKIKEKNSSFYVVDFIEIDDITKILNSKKYSQIFELVMECEYFQKSLLEDDLKQFII